MAFKQTVPSALPTVRKVYGQLAGVDFSNEAVNTPPNRSNDALNVWKNYKDTDGQAIETRPGIVKMRFVAESGGADASVYGLHFLGDKALIHGGTKLYKWVEFPDYQGETLYMDVAFSGMNEAPSTSFSFNGKLYIMDGLNYLVFDGTTVSLVSAAAFIPTTRIAADPNGANGTEYQGVNFINPYRRNTFVGNGSDTVFQLDVTSFDNEKPTVNVGGKIINGVIVGGSTIAAANVSFNYTTGTVTLTTAPAAPLTAGEENVIIQFKKTVTNSDFGAGSDYSLNITKCTIAKIFDNRVFVTGNAGKINTIYVSGLDDPTYFSDLAYYKDGDDRDPIMGLLTTQNALVVVKGGTGDSSKVFYHTPLATSDPAQARIYPSVEVPIARGCVSCVINFADELLYLSNEGLESIVISSSFKGIVHKSSLVDKKMINDINYKDAKMEIWGNYLVIFIGTSFYLYDSRQPCKINGHIEHEWYYWNDGSVAVSDAPTVIKEYLGVLYFCKTVNSIYGQVYKFFDSFVDGTSGTAENAVLIDSYWTTPPDVFGQITRNKNILRKGSIAQIKRIPNSKIIVGVKTDKDSEYVEVYEGYTEGFTYANFLYSTFSYGTGVDGLIKFRANKTRVKTISLKFYSDELGKPFGLYYATLEATIGNYY